MGALPENPAPPVARNVADDVLRRELRKNSASLARLADKLAQAGAQPAAEYAREAIECLQDAELSYVGSARPNESSYLRQAVALVRASRDSRQQAQGDEQP